MSPKLSHEARQKSRLETRHRDLSSTGAITEIWRWSVSGIVLAIGLLRAIQLRWICDDAFITMRYVKNFIDGKGLVYNAGEYVEGYTHFLWLLLLAAAKAIGFDSVSSSIWLGIAAFAGTLLLLLRVSSLEHRKRSIRLWLPLAAALFALNYDVQVWATGGLETSFYMLLIFGSFYAWFYLDLPERKRLLVTGTLLALVSLCRPDGVLFTATATLLLAAQGFRGSRPWSRVVQEVGFLLLPSVALGIPYLMWKYFYYGNILPLTYYAKSAGESYWSQGFYYIWFYFRIHFVSGSALLAAGIVLLWKNSELSSPGENQGRGSAVLAAVSAIVVYLVFFVARVGGDFMFARFIVPVLPFIYLVIEEGFEQFSNKLSVRLCVAGLLLMAIVTKDSIAPNPFFTIGQNGNREENWNRVVVEGATRFIADERWYYYDHREFSELPLGTMDVYSTIGKYYEPFFRGLPVTAGIPGSMNMIAYYANFETAINEYGLTDSFIAHLAERSRGHIGHEKYAPDDYLRRRHVDFELGKVVSKLPDPLAIDEVAFQIPELGLWQLGKVITYNRSLMNEIANRFEKSGRQVRLPLYEELIPEYVKLVMPSATLDELEADYAIFQRLYFHTYPAPVLEHSFEERIAELKKDSVMHDE